MIYRSCFVYEAPMFYRLQQQLKGKRKPKNVYYFTKLTRKVFLPVISNSFGKDTVNCIDFELMPVKISSAKYL